MPSREPRRPPRQPAVAPAATPADDPSIDPVAGWLPLAVVLIWQAVLLFPEATVSVPSKNDSALHLLMVQAANQQIAAGGNVLDFWIPQFELGFAQFQYYQHLPHLLLAALHRMTGGAIPIDTLFHGSQYLLLVAFPAVVAWSMRRMGFSIVSAAAGGAASCLFSANGRYGLEYESTIWRGIGLYSQLWGATLTCIALAGLVVLLRDGRGHLSTAVAIAALVLSHAISAFMLAITSVLVLLVAAPPARWAPRAMRLVTVGALAAIGASYFIVPFVASSGDFLNTLPGLAETAPRVGREVATVLDGRIFDADRLPVLTLLAGLGLVAALVRGGALRRMAAVGALWWFTLYVVRPSADWLPSHDRFVSFRFVLPLGIFASLLIGIAGESVSALVQRMVRRLAPNVSPRVATLIGSGLLLLALAPALVERTTYLRGNAQVIAETTAARAETPALDELLDYAATLEGRFFAGPVPGWGDALRVGPHVRVVDYLHARQLPAIGHPLQGLALNAGLLFSFRELEAPWYATYDVRHVVTPADATVPAFYSPRTTHGPFRLWSVPTRGPAYFVEVAERRQAMSQRALYEGNAAWLLASGPAMGSVIRWDYATPSGPPAPRASCAAEGSVRDVVQTSQSLTLRATCPHDAALAASIPYHPQWHARVDGNPVTPYMISPALLAIDMPAGSHEVELRYVANPVKRPLFVLALVCFGLAWWQRAQLDAPARWWMARTAGRPA